MDCQAAAGFLNPKPQSLIAHLHLRANRGWLLDVMQMGNSARYCTRIWQKTAFVEMWYNVCEAGDQACYGVLVAATVRQLNWGNISEYAWSGIDLLARLNAVVHA